MLASPDVNVQNQAMLYAAYNPAVAQYLDKYSGTKESTMVHSYLDRQRQLRDSLGRIGESVPVIAGGVRLFGVRRTSGSILGLCR
jgi:hypothetical protein